MSIANLIPKVTAGLQQLAAQVRQLAKQDAVEQSSDAHLAIIDLDLQGGLPKPECCRESSHRWEVGEAEGQGCCGKAGEGIEVGRLAVGSLYRVGCYIVLLAK